MQVLGQLDEVVVVGFEVPLVDRLVVRDAIAQLATTCPGVSVAPLATTRWRAVWIDFLVGLLKIDLGSSYHCPGSLTHQMASRSWSALRSAISKADRLSKNAPPTAMFHSYRSSAASRSPPVVVRYR